MAVRIYAGESWGSRRKSMFTLWKDFFTICPSRFSCLKSYIPSTTPSRNISSSTSLLCWKEIIRLFLFRTNRFIQWLCLSLRPWMALHSTNPFPELHWICNEGLEIRGTPYQKSGENGWPDEWCGMTNKREQATKFWNPICRPHTMVLYKDVQCLLSQGVKFCFFSMHEII